MTTEISPWPLTRKGDKEHPVRTLQRLLNARSQPARSQPVTVDGDFGPLTRAAVVAFQNSKGLSPDGIVGPNTWSALVIQVKKGDHGDAVKGVQEEFAFRNLSGDPALGLAVDGDFGPKTDAAVRGFQDALSLGTDGIVAPKTWRALISGMLAG